ncbi:hypothetical protein [Actinopolymorpha pittospori]|uniref:DNA primase n=1 Tax=Actinopolymorpha pittospori TaxID=648752 RepID=A0A927MQP6_9ACTN|nr:hypothetical protein [Actinopolymorpha pittospori]MBE1604334.1 hypothetical protein [Actinopolymorpha pittospori]
MNDSSKIALAVVGGYVLGRRKKVKMALLLGSALVGRHLDVRSLGKEVLGRLAGSPEVGRIVGDVRGEMMSTGRAAAVAVLSRPLDNLADRLEERTSRLAGAPPKGRREDEDEDDEYEDRAEDQEEEKEEEPERGRGEEEEEAPRRRRAARRESGYGGSERRRSPNAVSPRQGRDRESRTTNRTGRRGSGRG